MPNVKYFIVKLPRQSELEPALHFLRIPKTIGTLGTQRRNLLNLSASAFRIPKALKDMLNVDFGTN